MQHAMSKPEKKHYIAAWVSPATKRKLQAAAKKADRSLSYTIEKILSVGVSTQN
jgi:predicted transcriptional regulator